MSTIQGGPPSPPWDDNDLNGLDPLDVKDVDEFLSLSPESLRLDASGDNTDEVISTFLASASNEDFDELSRSSCSDINLSELFQDEEHEELNNNNNKVISTTETIKKTSSSSVGHCSVCALVFTSSSLLDQHRFDFEDQMTCCQCKKSFSTLSKLRTHHRKHSKEKPFQCTICGKYYTHRNTLSRHQLLYCRPLKIKTESEEECNLTEMILKAQVVLQEEDEKILKKRQMQTEKPPSVLEESSHAAKKVKLSKTKCLVCDSEFFDEASLENHREYHLSHRTCCQCHKVLGNKSKLLTHHRSHTKELPYNCGLCSKRFAELSTLRKHEATHGERNFRCDICSKAFVRKDYLSKHSLTHRQTFKCSQCAFVCHNKLDIERHLSQEH